LKKFFQNSVYEKISTIAFRRPEWIGAVLTELERDPSRIYSIAQAQAKSRNINDGLLFLRVDFCNYPDDEISRFRTYLCQSQRSRRISKTNIRIVFASWRQIMQISRFSNLAI